MGAGLITGWGAEDPTCSRAWPPPPKKKLRKRTSIDRKTHTCVFSNPWWPCCLESPPLECGFNLLFSNEQSIARVRECQFWGLVIKKPLVSFLSFLSFLALVTYLLGWSQLPRSEEPSGEAHEVRSWGRPQAKNQWRNEAISLTACEELNPASKALRELDSR